MSYWSYSETKLYIRRAEIKGMELKLGFEKSMKVFNTVWGRYLLKGRTEHKGCVAKECMDVLITSNSRIWWGRDTHPRVIVYFNLAFFLYIIFKIHTLDYLFIQLIWIYEFIALNTYVAHIKDYNIKLLSQKFWLK